MTTADFQWVLAPLLAADERYAIWRSDDRPQGPFIHYATTPAQSWTDPDAPYFGGLQMDLGFQERYGGWLLRAKGTADHWTPLEQIWIAEKAARSRGFYPWPSTARVCGLI